MPSVPFYDFPSSPLLIIGALGIVVALAVFFLAYQKYFNSPFNNVHQQKKKGLLREKKELSERLKKIDQDFENYGWFKNKGYPTKEHKLNILKYGLTKYHRLTFKTN